MVNIFGDIKTLDCLKNIFADKEDSEALTLERKLEGYVKKLCNIPNSSQKVTEWINVLIDEYNRRYNDLDIYERSSFNQCLYRAFDYFLPFLSTYEKMGALINMCSLADDEDEANREFHQNFFEISVCNATQYAKEIRFLEIANNEIENGNNFLFLLGFFNFRIQNYETAITYLEPCVTYRLNKINNDESVRLYIKSVIYLAESFEYNKNLDSALQELIGLDGIRLKEQLKSKEIRYTISQYLFTNYSNISKGEESIQYIKKVYEYLWGTQNPYPASYKVFQLEGINDILKSFVHVTAHCLSEYAAEYMLKVAKKERNISNDIRIYSLLQQISRFLMDWLVEQDDSYITCQATIRAENDACPEAIDILLKRLKRFHAIKDDELSEIQRMEKAELQFYIFYFAEQELSINNNREHLIFIFEQYGAEFVEFARKAKDTNALFHYLVIRFKYLLKKSAQDILQRNIASDYTELDAVYYQIIECRKKPLPHVFQELFQESDRLIEAYLLLREYRYLFREIPDRCNLEEFYNRLKLRRYGFATDVNERIIDATNSSDVDNTDDEELEVEDESSNVIKNLIDEIERRKRILILAPVKAAPSCSSDYVPVKQLYKLATRRRGTDTFKSVHFSFQQVSAEHGKKKGMDKFLHCENRELIKWMLYYDDAISALFLYYSEQCNEFKTEMFRANLNKNEKKHLDSLFASLRKDLSLKRKRVDCDQNEHKRIYGCGGACTTWLIKGRDVVNNEKLLEMLVFSEFDFYSHTCENKISDDDYIMFCVDEQYVKKYKIVCFSKLPDKSERGICDFCQCVDEEDTKSSEFSEQGVQINAFCNYNGVPDDLNKLEENMFCNYNGVPVDLNKLEENISSKLSEFQINGYSKTSAAYKCTKELHDKVCECRDSGICKKKDGLEKCELLDSCKENEIDIPKQKR